MMKNLALLVVIALAGLALALHFRHQAQLRLNQSEAHFQADAEALHQLTSDNQRLSNQLANAVKEIVPDHSNELTTLRRSAESLKSQTNQLAQKLATSKASISVEPEPAHPPRSPEYFKQLHQMAGNKPRDAARLAAAFLSYAADHGGQAPSKVEQLSPEFTAETGGSHFEIVYHGSMQDLQGIPGGAVAVLRDTETWTGPEGKPMRVYSMANGTGLIVGADESIERWEAKHIITPKPNAQGP